MSFANEFLVPCSSCGYVAFPPDNDAILSVVEERNSSLVFVEFYQKQTSGMTKSCVKYVKY